jgi:hypothetical protein
VGGKKKRMTDKDIEDLLNKISKLDIYLHKVIEEKEEDNISLAFERKNIFYLKDDLGLIKQLFHSEECIT